MQSQKLIHETDNRNYDYSSWQDENRDEYDYIINFIEPGRKIIDLGCGNGSLMQRLIREKKADVRGIELSNSAIEVCNKKGLNVISGRIDEKIPFDDNSFDYSICNVTIQMVSFPETLLAEMKRVSKFQIISFPNFAFYKNRLDLLFFGRMPHPMLFNHKWYNTGHIHQFSIKDFYDLLKDVGGLVIEDSTFIKSSNKFKNLMMKLFPNLFQFIPIFLLKNKNV